MGYEDDIDDESRPSLAQSLAEIGKACAEDPEFARRWAEGFRVAYSGLDGMLWHVPERVSMEGPA